MGAFGGQIKGDGLDPNSLYSPEPILQLDLNHPIASFPSPDHSELYKKYRLT
jgi:hypothetical protein